MSVGSAFSARVDASRVGVYLSDQVEGEPLRVRVDGEVVHVETALDLPGGGVVAAGSDVFDGSADLVVQWADGTTVDAVVGASDVINAVVWVSEERAGELEGLLGDQNGNPEDDLRARDGTVVPVDVEQEDLYDRFATTWRVEQAASLFDYAAGEDTTTHTLLDFPPRVVTLEDLDPAAVAAAEATCRAAGVRTEPSLSDCTFDVAFTGDDTWADLAARTESIERVRRVPDPELLVAADHGDLGAVTALLTADADPDLRRADGLTGLHFAAQGGSADIVRALLDAGADPAPTEEDGWTPLLLAAQNGHDDAVGLLLDAGADVDQGDPRGWTPLHAAADRGHTVVVQTLLSAGADRDAARDDGWTPMHFAAQNGHADVIGALLDARANPGRTEDDGWTPLLLAAQNGHDDAVGVLLDAGADVNQSDPNGWTPLHAAASRGHGDVVGALLDAGADPTLTTDTGSTPGEVARHRGHEEIASLLGG